MKKFIPSENVFAFAPIVRGGNRLEVLNQGDKHEIVLLGTIGKSWWDDSGVSEKEFRDALKTIPEGRQITVRVNSEGGSVKEGLGIYNAIKDRSKDITCRIDGYALSIASVFPLAASKVVSPKSAIWMIHCAWSWAQGNAADMEAAAEMLKEHDEMLCEIYMQETGKTKEEIETAMKAETWIRGSAAVDFGLADETGDEDKENASACYRPIHADFIKRCKNVSPEIVAEFSNRAKQWAKNVPISAPTQGAAKPQQQTKDNTVNKEAKIALLKSWGVEASASMTDAELDALIEKGKPQAKKEPENVSDIAALRQTVENYEQRRIEDKVRNYVIQNKITNAEVKIYVTAMKLDEAGTTKVLDEKVAQLPGGEPIGFSSATSRVVVDGVDFGSVKGRYSPELVNFYKEHKTPAARKAARADAWDTMMESAKARDMREGREVFAANTYSATLVTSFLMDGSVTDLQNIWAPLKAFTIDFTQDPYKPRSTGVLKHVTAGATVQTNATDFESGNSTVDASSVTMNQYTVSFQVSNDDLNKGLRMENLVTINVGNFANKIIEVATAPIVAGTFTNTPVISTAAAFGFSDLATLQASLKKSPIKNLILDGAYIARISNLPTFFQSAGTVGGGSNAWSAYGWNGIYNNTDWTGAGANIVGFACNPQAIAGIAGLPLTPPNIPGGIFSTSTMVLPGLNTSVMVGQWFNPKTRTMWCSYDMMLGVVAVDTTAGTIVASGTPG